MGCGCRKAKQEAAAAQRTEARAARIAQVQGGSTAATRAKLALERQQSNKS